MTVAFLVNGDAGSAMGDRAAAFASRLSPRWRTVTAWRRGARGAALRDFNAALAEARPDVIYVLDMAVAGIAAAAWWRIRHRAAVIVDTGDAITALARSNGRSPAALAATAALEGLALRLADHLVVRGSHHRTIVDGRMPAVTVIPDGVDLTRFRPTDSGPAKRSLGLDRDHVIGVLGSCTWNPRLKIAYGWDLIEALARLRDLPVKGLVIGDGSGIPHLRARAQALGVDDRVVFAGRRPMEELPPLLGACDICLSTQTNDVVGQVRTTGKLPLYLACGRFVLATDVGEAARVLPPEMLVPYDGVLDPAYPDRLADRIRTVIGRGLPPPEVSVRIAREHFDYDMLSRRLEAVLDQAGSTLRPVPSSQGIRA